MPEWSFDLVDSITGARNLDVVPSAGSWSRMISDTGRGSHTFQVKASEIPKAVWRQFTFPGANTLVQSWDGIPRYAGMVLSRKVNRDSGTVDLTTVDIRWILNKRLPYRVGEYASGDLVINNQTISGLVSEILKAGTFEADPNDPWNVRLRLPGPQPGPISRLARNWDFLTVDDLIREVEDREDGPDIDFEPRWSPDDGGIEYLVRVGGPRLEAPTYDFHMDTDEPSLTNVASEESFADTVTGIFAIGKGSEDDMRHGEAGALAGPRFPYIDAKIELKEIADVGLLNNHATSNLRANREPKPEWTMGFKASRYPSVNGFRLGSVLRLGFFGDWWEDDGWKPFYLLGMSGGIDENVTLTVQPLEAL